MSNKSLLSSRKSSNFNLGIYKCHYFIKGSKPIMIKLSSITPLKNHQNSDTKIHKIYV